MISFLLVTIFMLSGLSLLSYVYCWLDIRARRPHIISLRQITGIMDRNRLTQLFGEPERGYYYRLSPPLRRAILLRYRAHYYQMILADILCQFGAYRYMTAVAVPALEGWFILLAGLCQGINVVHSLWLVRKWRRQIGEEIDTSDD